MNKDLLYELFKIDLKCKYFSDNNLLYDNGIKKIYTNSNNEYYMIETPKLYIIVYNYLNSAFLEQKCIKRKNCYIFKEIKKKTNFY